MGFRGNRVATACLAFGLLSAAPAGAVIIDGTNQCTVKLSDGTDVVLYGEYVSPMARGETGAGGVPTLDQRVLERQTAAVTSRASNLALAGRQQFVNPQQATPVQELSVTEAARARFESLRSQFAAPDFKSHQKTNRFYYLPPGNSLHIAERADGTPEFLFVKYTTEETEEAGGVQGGLLHFLMEWGLTTQQEEQLRQKVESQCQGELVGSVEVDEDGDEGSFRIISATLTDDGMRRSLVQTGHAPTMPGGKVAAAANLSKNGAQLLAATFEQSRSISDLTVELSYSYLVQLPAAKGEIIFHWDRLTESVDTYEKTVKDYRHDWWEERPEDDDGTSIERDYSEDQAETLFNTMVEQGVVQFMFEGYQDDNEYTAQIQKAMFDYFLNSMMQPADDVRLEDLELADAEEEEPVLPGEGEEEEDWDDQSWKDRRYRFSKSATKSAFQAKKQVIRLDSGLAVRKRFQIVGNMTNWYDRVAGNPANVLTVNLNDPFFEHREIRFILDLDAKEIFEEMVNYVTVNVRKKRSKGTDFERSLTIDQKYLADRGVAASLTYAREEDRNSELYQYQTQWSIRGGNIFPRRALWQPGSWEGVTLSPPIEQWYVEVEGDIDQMAASDIARVTAELHYPLFGKEEYKVFAISPRAGNWIVGENIYVDRGTRGFAYRLIIHHKTEGRLVLPWQTRIGDRYVYATIPEEVLVAGQPREQAKQLAKEIGKLGAEKVLDKFQELFAQAD